MKLINLYKMFLATKFFLVERDNKLNNYNIEFNIFYFKIPIITFEASFTNSCPGSETFQSK